VDLSLDDGHNVVVAVPKIKATYSLDVETIEALETMARHWGVSKSEAVRRAIHAAAHLAQANERSAAIEALDALQAQLGLSAQAAEHWARTVRSERQESSKRRMP
jgi:predicted DNA-binding protein